MAPISKVLVDSNFMLDSQTQQYVSTNVNTTISSATITNQSGSNVYFSLNLVPGGQSPSASNIIIKERNLAPNQSYSCPEIVGQVLGSGGVISTIAQTASALVMKISGYEG